jgi:hypothetical protein
MKLDPEQKIKSGQALIRRQIKLPSGIIRLRSLSWVGEKGDWPRPSSTISAILIASSLYILPAARIRTLTCDRRVFTCSCTSAAVTANKRVSINAHS